MYAILHIPAEPLAPDNLWLALIVIAALASMAGLRAMISHFAQWRLGKPQRITG